MKHLLPLFVVLFMVSLFAVQDVEAQQYRRWNRYKKEFGLSLGGTVMMGDLGPGKSLRGFNFNNGGYTYGGFFKYRFHDRFAAKGNLLFGSLFSSDGSSPEGYLESRGISRGLNSKTKYTELSGQVEFYILQEKIGSRYKIRGVKGYGQSSFAMYVFAGLGVNFFNPYGLYVPTMEYIELAPLNTEGQGLPNGPEDYSRTTVLFPMGLGIKYNFNREWGVQLEGAYRFTTTDYLDDVSGVYYDSDALAAANGEISRYMAEKGHGRAKQGEVRGGPAKDLYVTGLLTVTYRMKSKARSRVRL
jgi:hypothetical protein